MCLQLSTLKLETDAKFGFFFACLYKMAKYLAILPKKVNLQPLKNNGNKD